MITTYELQKRMNGFKSGNVQDFLDIYRITVDDMYYQLQFIICDEAKTALLLEDFYNNLQKSAFELEQQSEMSTWLNEKITQVTTRWLNETVRIWCALSVPVFISRRSLPTVIFRASR